MVFSMGLWKIKLHKHWPTVLNVTQSVSRNSNTDKTKELARIIPHNNYYYYSSVSISTTPLIDALTGNSSEKSNV